MTTVFASGNHLTARPLVAQVVVNPLRTISKSSIRGRVIDETGDPVKGAMIVWGHGPMSANGGFVIVDDEGEFETPPQPDGTGRITVFAPGFSPDTVELKVGPDMAETEFVLSPGKQIQFQFQDIKGIAVPNVRVNIDRWRDTSALFNLPPRRDTDPDTKIPIRSDERGVFVWNWAPEDKVTYSFNCEGFVSHSETLTASDNAILITLQRPVKFRGQVTDQAGNPIQAFTVIPRMHGNEGSIQEFRTDSVKGEEGSFEIEIKRPEATYGVTVEADGYRTISTPGFDRDKIPKSLDLEMQEAPSIKYTVVDANGIPLVGAIAVAIADGQDYNQTSFQSQSVGEWLQHRKIDENGTFELPATSEPRTIFIYGIKDYAETGDFPDRPTNKIMASQLNDIKIDATLKGQPWKSTYFFRVIRYVRGLKKQNDTHRIGTSDNAGRIQIKNIPGLPCKVNIIDTKNPRGMRYELAFETEGSDVDLDFADATTTTAKIKFQGSNSNRVELTRSRFHLRSMEPAVELPTDVRLELKELGIEHLNVDEISQRLDELQNWALKRAYDDCFDTYMGTLSEEGSISVDILRPGKYALSIFAEAKSASNAWAHPLSRFQHEFEVGDQPLDLGTLEVDVFDDPLPGTLVEDFEFTPAGQSEPSRLSSLRGKYVLIDFWAPWCNVCERDTPKLHMLAKAVAKKGNTTILGIEAHGTGRTVRFPDQIPTGMNWIDAQVKYKEERHIQKQLGVWAPQHFVLVDPAGKYIAGGSLVLIASKLKEIGLK